MRSIFILFIAGVMALPVQAVELTFQTTETVAPTVTRAAINNGTVQVPAAVLDAGRVRKQVNFRGNKSAPFAEFENLALAPQQLYAKGLLNSAVAIDDQGVVNYAQLPDINVATAVNQVETKVTKRSPHNPAIAGYGRTSRDVYGALRAKRVQDKRRQQALSKTLDQFQVKAGRMQEKIDPRLL